jgi:hypothetical protein
MHVVHFQMPESAFGFTLVNPAASGLVGLESSLTNPTRPLAAENEPHSPPNQLRAHSPNKKNKEEIFFLAPLFL